MARLISMLKTVFAKFALFALLALFFAHVDAARVGDSGKGWRVVKADNYDGVTCVRIRVPSRGA